MRRTYQIFVLVIILLCLIAAAILGLYSAFESTSEMQPTLQTPPLPAPIAPDLTELANRLSQPPALTAEQLQEDKEIQQSQVATASEWLFDPNPQQRVSGAEQLSAYPTPEAEKLLREIVSGDVAAEVRAAAAASLSYFNAPDAETIDALLQALQDEEQVSQRAFSTLSIQLSKYPVDSPEFKQLSQRLKNRLHSKELSDDIRNALKDLLEYKGIK